MLKVLLERLNECSIQMPEGEFVQAEEKQKRNLAAVLAQTEEIIGIDKEGEKKYVHRDHLTCAYWHDLSIPQLER